MSIPYEKVVRDYNNLKDKRCPYCKQEMICAPQIRKKTFPRNAMTRDHNILPRCYYTEEIRNFFMNKNARNFIMVCNSCNCRRAQPKYNHCVAAMILDRLINGDERFYK